MSKKQMTVQELSLKLDGMPEAQANFMKKCAEMMVDIINKSNEGLMTDTEFAEKMKEALKPFEGVENESLKSLVADNKEALKLIASLGEEIAKMKQKGISTDFISKFDESFNEMWESEKFKKFAYENGAPAKGFVIKDVSLSGNYDGSVMLTEQSNVVVSRATDKRDHIRNHTTVLQGDPEKPYFGFQEIYEVDRNARYVSENGMLPESSFKVREATAEVKRVGTYFKMSKRMLKSRVYVRSFILNKIVSAVLMAEDFGILFGDGSGDNLKGITTYEGVIPVEKILKDAIVSIAAGGFEAVEKAKNGVIVTLAKPNDLIMEGLKIIVAGATTATDLNGTFDVIKLNDTQLLLEGVTYTEDMATEAANLTAKIHNGLYQSIEEPNSIDALEAAVAVMTYAEYEPTVLMLNPLTITAIKSEKATDGNRLDVVKDIRGNMVIGNLTVVPNKDIPMGKYFLGDMNNGANIVDYTPLTLEWADDVNTKLKNQIVLMAQEELIVPVFCPWAFSYGKLSDLKDALKKA